MESGALLEGPPLKLRLGGSLRRNECEPLLWSD